MQMPSFLEPREARYVIPSTGYYDFRVAGASGGTTPSPTGGGIGALVGGELFLAAGETLDVLVGGGPSGIGSNGSGGGGAGVASSSVKVCCLPRAAAAALFSRAAAGLLESAPAAIHPVRKVTAAEVAAAFPYCRLCLPEGYGVARRRADRFPMAAKARWRALSRVIVLGSARAGATAAAAGADIMVVAAAAGAPGGSSGQGGYSYVIDTARNAFGITGGNPGVNGYVPINFVAAPEPSTWAMTLAGFAGLGWLARLRSRKMSPT